MDALLLILLLFLGAFAAVNVAYALLMVAVMLLRAVMSGIVIPLVMLVFKLIALPFQVAGWLLSPPAGSRAPAPVSLGVACETRRCGCDNPAGARFCRRCGRHLAA